MFCKKYKKPYTGRIWCIFAAAVLVSASAALADFQPQGLAFANIYTLGTEQNITGKDVNIGAVCRSITYSGNQPQNDYQVDVSHACFDSNSVNFFNDDWDQPGISGHSTAIASILTGYDPNAYYEPVGNFEYRGAVPDANLNVYEFWDFATKYVFAGKRPEADILTISLGSVFEGWWTRGLEKMAGDNGLLIIAAIGNGKNAFDTPLYPAAGANILAVGVVDSNDSLDEFASVDPNTSSIGPTNDGRCKPDIVAPGNCLAAVAGTKNEYAPAGDYSSFAAPVVTGAAAMLIQEIKSDPNLQFALMPVFGNCVLKSILMTSAEKLDGWHKGFAGKEDDSEYPLDLTQGAGVVDAAAAYKLLKAGMQRSDVSDAKDIGWDVNLLEADYAAESVYRIKIDNSAKAELTVTLNWNRIYQDNYPFNPVMDSYSDLRLEVWAIDVYGARKELVELSDSPVDNVEHIFAELDSVYNRYEIVVANSPTVNLPKTAIPFAISWQTK